MDETKEQKQKREKRENEKRETRKEKEGNKNKQEPRESRRKQWGNHIIKIMSHAMGNGTNVLHTKWTGFAVGSMWGQYHFVIFQEK